MQILSQAIQQGTVVSGSVLNTVAQTLHYAASLSMGAPDLNDPALFIALTLQISLEPGIWRSVAEYEWRGGQGTTPQATWSGLARRVRLALDISRPVSVGAILSSSS